MEPFVTHAGRALPLRRNNVDTDQIIPAEYLKRVSRAGFGEGLFAAWREDPSFVLNQPQYDGATILVAGTDFGTGSSREHAVWALTDYGFRAVIAPRFGDIFRTNATKAGLLPVALPEATVTALQDAIEADPGTEVVVDLDNRVVLAEAAGIKASFEIDDYTRWRLMEGLDDIGLTLATSTTSPPSSTTAPPTSPSPPDPPACVVPGSRRPGIKAPFEIDVPVPLRGCWSGRDEHRPDAAGQARTHRAKRHRNRALSDTLRVSAGCLAWDIGRHAGQSGHGYCATALDRLLSGRSEVAISYRSPRDLWGKRRSEP